jgi:predicted Zn finger-like uncharacterized protein
MEVRCERCKTQYELDDSRVSETGVTVQCTTCHHVFVVKKKALVVTMAVKPGEQNPATPVPLGGTQPAPPPAGIRPLGPPIREPPPVGTVSANQGTMEAPGERGRDWRVRQASGNLFTLKDLTTLQKWIVERKVSRDDEISLTGDSWKRLGDIAELATFFQLVDEAQKAAVLQAQVNLGMVQGAPPPAGNAHAAEPPAPLLVAPPAAPPPRAREPERKERRSPVLLVLLLLLLLGGGGSAFYYFQVYLPGLAAEEAERVAAAQRLEQERLARLEQERLARLEQERLEKERLEKERQEQLRAEQAAAEAAARADAGSSEDGGTLAGGALGAGDGGTPDAGGLADAGAPTVKRPAPVRDFDYYMTQGDRSRERERLQAALDAYGEAAELEPDRAEPYTGRGMTFLDMGDTRQAETEFKQALKFNPRYGDAIIGLAETYRSQGKKADAVRYYERYLEILPNGPEASVARSAIERLKE